VGAPPDRQTPAPHLARPLTRESITERLQEAGIRLTTARSRVIDELLAASSPLSINQIINQVGENGPDYATVFRALSLLEDCGLVARVNMERPESYFELRDPSRHYDHVICTKCGKARLIEEPCPLGHFEEHIRQRYGFTKLRHSLEFFGVCEDCSTNEDATTNNTPS